MVMTRLSIGLPCPILSSRRGQPKLLRCCSRPAPLAAPTTTVWALNHVADCLVGRSPKSGDPPRTQQLSAGVLGCTPQWSTFRLGGQFTFSITYIHTQSTTTLYAGITTNTTKITDSKRCTDSTYSCATPPPPLPPAPSPSTPTITPPSAASSTAAAARPRSLSKLADPL